MGKPLELTGKRFGMLTVIDRVENCSYGNAQWKCECECGTIKIISSSNLTRTKSCGCLNRELTSERNSTHGQTKGKKTAEYIVWVGIKTRCNNPKSEFYKNYGGRGITVCHEWEDSFIQFFYDMGPRPTSKHTIDRIDNNLGYYKENCRWATRKEQSRNKNNNFKVSYLGINYHSLAELSEKYNCKYKQLHKFVKSGGSIDEGVKRYGTQ